MMKPDRTGVRLHALHYPSDRNAIVIVISSEIDEHDATLIGRTLDALEHVDDAPDLEIDLMGQHHVVSPSTITAWKARALRLRTRGQRLAILNAPASLRHSLQEAGLTD
jgi:hypothetical protein